MAYRNYSTANGFTVDKTGNGDFTTIASALTAAVSGDTIFIRPGTYTENPTLVAGVNLTAFGSDSSLSATGNVIINGNCTLSTAGSVTISGIQLQTNSNNLLTVSGSVASIVNLENCYLNCTNNTGISFSSSSASAVINMYRCQANLGTTGIALFSMSSAGLLRFYYTTLQNSGSSTTANTISAGQIDLLDSALSSPLTSSSTALVTASRTIFNLAGLNVIALTLGGSATSAISNCYVSSGTASAITISTTATITDSVILTSNTNAITGAGTINYTGLDFTNSQLINTTTQSGGISTGIRSGTAPAAGFIGEQIRSTVASPGGGVLNNTPTNVTSINLTSGVWDVSGVLAINGTLTGTVFNASISTASATNGTFGDNAVETPTMSTANSDHTQVIPAFRVTVSTATTVYLVISILFTVGTCKAYGRISATRVG